MKYHVTAGGKEHVVVISGTTATVTSPDGTTTVVHLAPQAPTAVLAQARSDEETSVVQRHRVELVGSPQQATHRDLQVLLDNAPVFVTVESERDRLSAHAVDESERGSHSTLRSLLPGVIRRILRRPGDRVAAGTPIVTLEAMKMENEVRADMDGTVQRVHVQEGQIVNTGDPLVELEA